MPTEGPAIAAGAIDGVISYVGLFGGEDSSFAEGADRGETIACAVEADVDGGI